MKIFISFTELLSDTLMWSFVTLGFGCFIAFGPYTFDISLSLLNDIRSGVRNYESFFYTLYFLCLAIGFLISIIVKITIKNLSRSLLKNSLREIEKGEEGFASATKNCTLKDLHRIAAHEAGHLLVYAALGQLPNGVKAEVKTQTDHTNSLGYVTGVISKGVTFSRLFSEWQMLMILGGRVGESTLLNDNTLGSIEDHQRWLNAAKSYLSNYFTEIFYPDAQSEFEAKHNNEQLLVLKNKQEDLLQQFFALNMEHLTVLKETLQQQKVMLAEDIIAFFQQANIRFPDNFPLPFGQFDKFSSQWELSEEYGTPNEALEERLGINDLDNN
ncbi:hypothetical protein HEMROJRC1_20810 [Rodentibacter sp. JRC1]|uniref:hypothetical protein n=1 Tax=Rodentibacter sp. JRC1 TaxID=2874504 RepID=UPI001CFD28DF|nr:hypothetical protein [Rodentibacter sp. JRC1]GJI56969.1 hypothetical protein HEMROJRC1_20810 [Rodentibacter sp. JRC1]